MYTRTVQRLKLLTDAELRALAERHEFNFSAVARELGTCEATTRAYLRRLGLKPANTRRKPERPREELVALYKSCGYNMTTVSKQLGLSRERVRQLLAKAKIPHGRKLARTHMSVYACGRALSDEARQSILTLRRQGCTYKAIQAAVGYSCSTIHRLLVVHKLLVGNVALSKVRIQKRLAAAQKKCSRCGETKPTTQFHLSYRNGKPTAYRPECKACIAAYVWLRRGCRTPRRKYAVPVDLS